MAEFTQDNLSLYTPRGERKYVNRTERRRVLTVMETMKRDRALFGLLLAWTGARVSEVLAVRANSFQLDRNLVSLQTLKRRKPHVREVPISPGLMTAIARHFRLRELQLASETANRRLWSFSRVTAWRLVKGAMLEAGVVGRPACPRGLRHGFGVGTLQAGVPLNLVQRWIGHARISTTAIYADATGPEEMLFAERFWRSASTEQSTAAARPTRKRKNGFRHRRRRMPVFGQLRRWSGQFAIVLCAVLGVVAGLQALTRLVVP